VTGEIRVFSRVGLGYALLVEDLSLELRASHLKRVGGELHCDLAVRTNFLGVKTVDGILHAARFNLSSTSARGTLVKALSARTPGSAFDWPIYLEELCQKILAAEARSEPAVEIGFDPVEADHYRHAVEPIMAKGAPAQLYGPGGSMKSALAQAVMVSIAAGRELIPGIAPAIKGPILYLDWETNRRMVNARVQAICAGAGIDVPHGFHYVRMHKRLADEAEELAATVASSGIVAVAVDSAAFAIGGQGEHAGAEDGALRFLEAIRCFGDTVSTLFINHVPGVELTEPTNGHARKPYGSVFLINGARLNWELRKELEVNGRQALRLFDYKPNDFGIHAPVALGVEWLPGEIRFGAAPSFERSTVGDQIADLLEGAQMRGPDIARTLNLPADTVRVTLNRDGRFTRSEAGLWTVTTVTA
jgi:hypothetical protein